MNINKTRRVLTIIATLAILSSLFSSALAAPAATTVQARANPVTFTILHTNDFHGQLEEVLSTSPADGSSSNPGMARVATIVNNVRTAVGADKVLLVDGGDEMQGSLLSNLQKGAPTIATFNSMGYNAATFGNHEFDWGQTVLGNRTAQATYPYVTANIVKNDTGNCATAGWTPPTFADAPYQISTITSGADTVKVAFIGVTTAETPTITLASATAGLCFKDPAQSISYYYPTMLAAGADVIVVLSHLGNVDGGYGYGLPVYGDQTLAARLNTAGTPVNLIIGGHSHTNLSAAQTVGTTKVVQAHYNGRKVGRADITVSPTGSVSVTWTRLWVCAANNTNAACPAGPTLEDATTKALITTYSSDSDYQTLINTEIGWTNVPIMRNYDGDSLMGYFVNDAVYGDLNGDGTTSNDVDMVFNNPGGLRTDITCAAYPCLVNYGMTFNVLPFGNQTIVGDMRGDKILELLHQSATLFKGAIQPSGIRYSFFRYSDALPGPQPYGWGAYDVTVYDKATSSWVPLDLTKTYRVATNEFLAPAGQDGFTPFKYMTNISYWGDMLDGVNRYVSATYPSSNPYNGVLDGRITRDGTDAGGSIVPLTVLHHNDPHGNLYKYSYNSYSAGLTQLATLIKQEKLHNPTRTLLLNAGDTIQGDGMSFYFKSGYTGFAVDGTALTVPPQATDMTTNPIIAVMNALGYDAMTLGNHEFNFGNGVFKGVLGQANFAILDANVTDGAGGNTYGLSFANGGVGVQPYIEKTLGAENIKVGILGLGNPRVPNYELPSNILGLTFANNTGVNDPITRGQTVANTLRANNNDVVLALSHLGFTDATDPWVDTYLASHTTGIDAIIGGHSHTEPTNTVASPYLGSYKYLPSIVAAADGKPVSINQAFRHNYFLGEVVLGLRTKLGGGYEVVSQVGRDIPVCSNGRQLGSSTGPTCSPDTAEDAATVALMAPYKALFTTYNNTVVGSTTAPIDTRLAFTKETNGANLQADASVYELSVKHSIPVDFHLSGAMTNNLMASTATPASPVSLKISDMFAGMPYENSLVVLSMNGPQLKTVLERAYRNYYYYQYGGANWGGYSHYTTCMLDINAGGKITYRDQYPTTPSGNNVISLVFDKAGTPTTVDFTDATTYYNVSTVNYLAAGSCNFNDAPGTSLWPLAQTVADTQYYVRDAVIDYLTFKGTVSPAIEGRLQFNYAVSGSLGVSGAGATVAFTGGTPVTANGSGNYSFLVPSGWTGTITPTKSGYAFTPASITISTPVTADLSGQNFTAASRAFVKYNPVNGATGVSTSPLLTWQTSQGAASYEYCLDTSNDTLCDTGWVTQGTNKSVVLSGLAADTTYYWQARSVRADGSVEANGGTWWSFTTVGCYTLTTSGLPSGSVTASPAPNCTGGKYLSGTVVQLTPRPAYGYVFVNWSGALSGSASPASVTMDADKSVTANFITPPSSFTKYVPGNTATNVTINPVLNWQTSTGATRYEYCIDTSNDTVCDTGWIDRGTSKSIALSGLTGNTTYYWQARAINPDGTVEANSGAWWSFTTVACYTLTTSGSPTGSVYASPATNCPGGKYVAGTVVQLSPRPAYGYTFSTWSGGLTGSANPGSVTMDADKSVTANYTTPPTPFIKYNQANGATGVSKSPVLNWQTSYNATSYEYCLDTIDNGSCDTGWVSRGSLKSIALTGLTGTTTYYWQVRAVNGVATVYANSGTWWSFTTVP